MITDNGPELDQQIEQLVHAWQGHDIEADALLMTLTYHKIYELVRKDKAKRNASLFMESFRTSDFVHDVWFRIASTESTINIETKKHFYDYIQSAIHSHLVDQAKKASTHKRSSTVVSLPAYQSEESVCSESIFEEITAVTALERLMEYHQGHAKLLMYKYYLGLTTKEIATINNISINEIETETKKAKITLKQILNTSAV